MLHLVPWWLTLQVAGMAAIPWGLLLFRALPDRGYGLSKALGVLLLSYAYWAVVVTGLLPNATPALLLVLLLYLSASAYLGWRQRAELLLFLRYNRGLLLLEECIFTGAFLLFAGFRMLAPDIHLTTALTVTTEQPMDLAFLSGVLRSPTFPPADPWLAGHPMSYYYLGYLALGLPARLAGAAPAVAYNLALATVFALAAVGVFSVASGAVGLARFGRRGEGRGSALPIVAGIGALLFLLVAGNMVGIEEVLRRLGAGGQGGVLGDPNWWWKPSRVIVDGTAAEPIDEFPAFSLVLGDLHPHLMALPFALLVLGVALAWLARSEAPGARWPLRQPGEMALIALVVGAPGFVNTWDLPVYLMVLLGAILVRRIRQEAQGRRAVATDILAPGLALTGLALLLYLPFYVHLGGQFQGVVPLAQTGTRPVHYLLLWGPLLVAAVPPTVAAAWVKAQRRSLSPGNLMVLAVVALAPVALWNLALLLWDLFPVAGTPPGPGGIVGRWVLVAPAVALLFLSLVALAPSPWEETPPAGRSFGYLILTAATLLILTPELFFARDLFQTRMNTVFKLHYQAWLLLSVGGGIGLAWLLAQPRPRGPLGRLAASAGLALMLLLATLALGYGLLAGATRVRHSPGASPALDGLAFYRRQYPNEVAAMEWLQRAAPRGAVVLEAAGDDYSDFGRVSAITGIPTLIGWEGHELQWHSGYALFAGRRTDVATIYAGDDPERARQLLAFYEVQYVFGGRLERQAYGADVAERVGRLLPGGEAYRSGDVVVFQVPGE